MIFEVVQSKWLLTWYDPLGPRMCVLELMNGHVLQTLREQLKVPGSRLEGSELLTSVGNPGFYVGSIGNPGFYVVYHSFIHLCRVQIKQKRTKIRCFDKVGQG